MQRKRDRVDPPELILQNCRIELNPLPGVLHGGGDSVVHWSGLVLLALLASALATGEATLILQACQNKSLASKPARE